MRCRGSGCCSCEVSMLMCYASNVFEAAPINSLSHHPRKHHPRQLLLSRKRVCVVTSRTILCGTAHCTYTKIQPQSRNSSTDVAASTPPAPRAVASATIPLPGSQSRAANVSAPLSPSVAAVAPSGVNSTRGSPVKTFLAPILPCPSTPMTKPSPPLHIHRKHARSPLLFPAPLLWLRSPCGLPSSRLLLRSSS